MRLGAQFEYAYMHVTVVHAVNMTGDLQKWQKKKVAIFVQKEKGCKGVLLLKTTEGGNLDVLCLSLFS